MKWKLLSAFLFAVFSAAIAPIRASSDQSLSATIFQRLVGIPLNPGVEGYQEFVRLDAKGASAFEIASAITRSSSFQNTALFQFATRFSNTASNLSSEVRLAPLDDLQATIIGTVANDIDFRTILSGAQYFDFGDSNAKSDVFAKKGSFINASVRRAPNPNFHPEAAGVILTDRFAELNFTAGTNRRPLKYILEKFLCAPIARWKDQRIDDRYVRQDIDRSPGDANGNKRFVYEQDCRGCHAPMDAMANAFSKTDLVELRTYELPARTKYIARILVGVVPKIDRSVVYAQGYAPIDDSWRNLLQDKLLGLPNGGGGNGIHSLGVYLSHATAFRSCMVKRVVDEVCPKNAFDQTTIDTLNKNFADSNFNLRLVFASVAANDRCQTSTGVGLLTTRPLAEKMVSHFRILVPNIELARIRKTVDLSFKREDLPYLPRLGALDEATKPMTRKAILGAASRYCQSIIESAPQTSTKNIYNVFLGRNANAKEQGWDRTENQSSQNALNACIRVVSSIEYLVSKEGR